jgi:hypothetical protein
MVMTQTHKQNQLFSELDRHRAMADGPCISFVDDQHREDLALYRHNLNLVHRRALYIEIPNPPAYAKRRTSLRWLVEPILIALGEHEGYDIKRSHELAIQALYAKQHINCTFLDSFDRLEQRTQPFTAELLWLTHMYLVSLQNHHLVVIGNIKTLEGIAANISHPNVHQQWIA